MGGWVWGMLCGVRWGSGFRCSASVVLDCSYDLYGIADTQVLLIGLFEEGVWYCRVSRSSLVFCLAVSLFTLVTSLI